ncbi:hypothetical protein H4219_000503 [Mycoemilia scoparia]|uniref:Multifunctional methyltransferase subunit TRM112-like protein n=1 Tax=Mycoemilia scoparia TaxID=417184 RepID=A0A9W8AAU2_9FUNG|nr:hypothetical protein H4219_000503 [Mycoemilia scoparia]
MLQCHAKGCDDPAKNFPLEISDFTKEEIEAEKNKDFLVRMLPKLEWNALYTTAVKLGITGLPETLPSDAETNDEFLSALHTVLLEVHIKEGKMTCNGCNHVYPIKDGVPNMLLAEHEI